CCGLALASRIDAKSGVYSRVARGFTGCGRNENGYTKKNIEEAQQTEGKTRAQMVERILQKLEMAFAKDGGVKATLGDYIRLVQLRKEMDEDEPREIRVTWVEP